jgi:hypothetical protein
MCKNVDQPDQSANLPHEPDPFKEWVNAQWATGLARATSRMRRAQTNSDPAVRESAMGQGSIATED